MAETHQFYFTLDSAADAAGNLQRSLRQYTVRKIRERHGERKKNGECEGRQGQGKVEE